MPIVFARPVPPPTPWDVSNASYDSVTFSVSSQETGPAAFAFKSDGTKMYVVGYGNDTVYQYTLSTPWDMGTASYDSVSFSVSSQETVPLGIAFKTDGTKMYIVGDSSDTVYQYTLSTPWDMTTASYDSVSFSVSAQAFSPTEVTFKSDGTKMYVAQHTTAVVFQYTLSTPWVVSTASYDSVSLNVDTDGAGQVTAVAFSTDGTAMFALGLTNDTVYQYTLSSPWDLSTASYDSISFSVASQDTTPRGLAFKTDGTKMYMLGDITASAYQYSL